MVHEQAEPEWPTTRSWSRGISLQVREVTSVSITFIFRSSIGAPNELFSGGGETDEEEQVGGLTISDALGRGLAVKVNGNHWQRVVVHVDEDEEEAIVIVYGLLPRKKYELALSIVGSDEVFPENITTLPRPDHDHVVSALSSSNVTAPMPEAGASASTLTPPTTPVRSSPPRPTTQEERVVQLRKQLILLTAERDDLTSQLKLARRESQRTETTLKSEIETLKRTSEKHSSGEHRSRQKVLALQEAVKQASAAAGDIEQMVRDVEATMPGLSERANDVQVLHHHVKEEAERRCAELDAADHQNRKIVNELQGELTNACARLEKMTGKKDRLEKEVPRLEEKLQELRRELEGIERVTPENDLEHKYDNDGTSYGRNWIPPIQRPSHAQLASFLPLNSMNTPLAVPHQVPLHSGRSHNSKIRTSSVPPPLFPSYDQSLSLRPLAEEDTGSPLPRLTSELKPGSTFHTPPRFQGYKVTYLNKSPSELILPRRSSNSSSGKERA